ncbi:MAG: nitrite/sulfite reductase, partial [Candidatus Binatia bacterium]
GHRDAQEFGRKFKVAFSGCADKACGLVNMHDLGFIGRVREVEGVQRRGFETFVGGGLGTIPYPAQLFDDFVPEEEILPLAQAICRVFARLGEKRNRARARLKFLVAKLGIEEFRRLVLEERAGLLHDAAWTDWLEERKDWNEVALKAPSVLGTGVKPSGFDRWYRSNVAPQKQAGYAVVTVALPLGDLSSWQIRRLAAIARRYVGDKLRTTVEQNIVLRWVSEADLPELYAELCQAGLGAPGAGTMTDITACPGTDTCKLGIASSRGLARELSTRLASRSVELDGAIEGLHVKISGCFNSCGQHHIADLGFYGVSRKVGGTTVPHFQVVLGGQWEANAGAYGLAMGAVPSRRVPEVVERLTDHYVKQRQDGETFRGFVARIGKKAIRGFLQDLMVVPAYEEDSSFYSDWGDPREFTLSDLGVGECAGEVVAQADFDLAAAEGDVFDAQISLDEGDYDRAGDIAYRSMLEAARGLIRVQFPDVGEDPDGIVGEFKKRFCDTELFYDKYAGAKFAHYLLRRHAEGTSKVDEDYARRLVEEAQLFIEAAHACYLRMLETPAGVVSPPV